MAAGASEAGTRGASGATGGVARSSEATGGVAGSHGGLHGVEWRKSMRSRMVRGRMRPSGDESSSRWATAWTSLEALHATLDAAGQRALQGAAGHVGGAEEVAEEVDAPQDQSGSHVVLSLG